MNSLPWHLLTLIAGGNALGLAVHDSGLLQMMAKYVFRLLGDDGLPAAGIELWLITAELVGGVLFVGATV